MSHIPSINLKHLQIFHQNYLIFKGINKNYLKINNCQETAKKANEIFLHLLRDSHQQNKYGGHTNSHKYPMFLYVSVIPPSLKSSHGHVTSY